MRALDMVSASVWVPVGDPARQDRAVLLDGVTWSVAAGERWAVLGPNGAGKSTMLTLAAATRHPSSGTVRVLGQLLGRTDLRALRAHLGVVDAALRVPPRLSIRDYVLTGLTGTVQPLRARYPAAQERRAEELRDTLGLSRVWTSPCGTCSAGERSRARIARALVAGPALLLLDEPAAALDLAGREDLLDALDGLALAQPDLASVVVTHHVEELASSTTHALLLRAGRVTAAGPVEQVLTAERLSACFDLPVRVTRSGRRFAAVAERGRPEPAGSRSLRPGEGWHDEAMSDRLPDEVPTRLDTMQVVVQAEFAAPAERVWDLLTDVEAMAGLGPEHDSARWLDPGPAVGARFLGHNVRGGREWEVTCRVAACERPWLFTWTTGDPAEPSATWRYDLLRAPGGRTVVTQTFTAGRGFTFLRRSVEKYPDREAEFVAGRARELAANMRAVLAAAARLAERES